MYNKLFSGIEVNKMTGVYFDANKLKWTAKLQYKGTIYKKSFADQQDAINFRNDLERKIKMLPYNTSTTSNNQAGAAHDEIKQNVKSNLAYHNEIKQVIYDGYMQGFTYTNLETGEQFSGKYKVSPVRGKIIHQDHATIVILEDGSKGVSKCCPKDTYSRKKGLKIAYNRALIQKLQNEINRIAQGK
jgi:hypothetical protein